MNTTFNDMTKFLDEAWCARKYVVPCLLGPAGIGKTAAVMQHAKNVGAEVVMIIASQILPNEVSGITMPVHETKAMEIYDHYRLSSLKDGDILFFDELLEADQLVLSACLTLIESRQLMSGKQLPDVQIVAATNATISPKMLKESIRQRFVWREFHIDREGTRQYIKDTYGFDVGSSISGQLVGSSDSYNILTPRSLTKMAAWMAESNGNKEKANSIGTQIDMIWGCAIGHRLAEAYMETFSSPMKQVQVALHELIVSAGIDNSEIDGIMESDLTDTTLTELIGLLQQLPEWGSMQEYLSDLMINEEDEYHIEF